MHWNKSFLCLKRLKGLKIVWLKIDSLAANEEQKFIWVPQMQRNLIFATILSFIL